MFNRNRRKLQRTNFFQSFRRTNYWASRIYDCLSTIALHAIGLDVAPHLNLHLLNIYCDAISVMLSMPKITHTTTIIHPSMEDTCMAAIMMIIFLFHFLMVRRVYLCI